MMKSISIFGHELLYCKANAVRIMLCRLPSAQYEVVDTIRAEASWGKCVIFIQKRQEDDDVTSDLDFLYAEGIIQNRRI